MAPFTVLSLGVGLFLKPSALLCSVSALRCTCALPVLRSFSSTTEGPPKRPKTSYMRFVEQQWPTVIRQYPVVKAVEVTRKIAQQWRELTPEQKKPFQEASAAEREVYNTVLEKYRAQLSPSQSAALKEERRQRLAKRKAIRKKRELTNLGKPKRQRTALFIFISENFPEAKGATMLTKTQSLMEKWKRLTEVEKRMYIQQAEDDKIRYRNEMKSWEEHMREIGREDLIRRKVSGTKRAKRKPGAVAGRKKSRVKPAKSKDRSVKAKSAASEQPAPASPTKAGKKARKTEE